ncbi:MAG: class SAM-dependent methyltransferase [Hyphomicrobiales bacterium]|jgi:predicted O-methyltransferase YrrM|nr:class SAM-dependent methyltransferase [Hyphomicrobiales bacterium]
MQSGTDNVMDVLVTAINRNVLGKHTDVYDVLTAAQMVASFDSASYFNRNMSAAANFRNGLDLLGHAMQLRSVPGPILEFGVATGRTINHLASLTAEQIYGFDSFEGLPEDWRTGYSKGRFAQALPMTAPNVRLLVGWFENSLDEFAALCPEGPISLIHVDCDLYSSTKTILERLAHRIVPGTVLVFDEYFNYPGWEAHEFKAWQEFCAAQNITYRYDSFVSSHQQVCVVVE